MLEVIGYVASVIVAVSLMMSSLLRLRIVNLVGSTLFAIYGYAIGALPVAAVNGFIAVVNIYFITKMLRTREYFCILQLEPDSEYLRYYLERNDAEIRRFLPAFDARPSPDALTLFVLRDVVPAGLFIAEPAEGETWRVRLDYVLPGYRDLKVGRFLFDERADFFREHGIGRLVTQPGNAQHERYLGRMGFRRAANGLLERAIG